MVLKVVLLVVNVIVCLCVGVSGGFVFLVSTTFHDNAIQKVYQNTITLNVLPESYKKLFDVLILYCNILKSIIDLIICVTFKHFFQ